MPTDQPLASTHPRALSLVESITQGRDVLAALAAAWSSSAGQLGLSDQDFCPDSRTAPESSMSSRRVPRTR